MCLCPCSIFLVKQRSFVRPLFSREELVLALLVWFFGSLLSGLWLGRGLGLVGLLACLQAF